MGQNNNNLIFWGVYMWLHASWPLCVVVGCSVFGSVNSSCLSVDPQGFSGMFGAHLHGALSPAVGALESGLELSTVLPHPSWPSWEDVEALSHCTALNCLQQNTFPVPSEVTLWDTG